MKLTSPVLSGVRGVAHGFFGRRGGVSRGLYASLNCGYGSGDDLGLVKENRTRAATSLGTSEERLLTVYQIHSAEAVIVTEPWLRADAPKVDAMATKEKGVALGVLAADCAPVLFADEKAQVIGAAHAGWKGALGGVLEAAIEAMEKLGAQRSHVHATVGPCISQRSYEVGPEFYAAFAASKPENARYFEPSRRTGHWQFDLPAYVVARLAQAGLAKIDPMNMCTCDNEGDYFSYRRATHRSESHYGRNLSAIMLTP